MSTPRSPLPFERWPEPYRADWDRTTAFPESLFDAAAAAAELRPRSVAAYQYALCSWLGFLDRRGWLDPAVPAAEAVTPDRLHAYVAEQRALGNANATIKMRLACLHAAFRLMAPEAALGFLRRPGGLPLDRALPSTPKRQPVRDFRELLDLACQLHRQGLASRHPTQGRTAIRDAAILGVLALYAPRVGALAAMEADAHLIRSGDGYWLWLGEDVDKTWVSNSHPIHGVLTPLLDAYLDGVRPSFGGHATAVLWLSSAGRPLGTGGIGGMVRHRTRQWFGEGRGPHWFRKCLTTTVATESPEHALDAAALLGHGPEVGLRHYNMACAAAALRRHNNLIADRREATRGLAARIFREKGLDTGRFRGARAGRKRTDPCGNG